MHHEIFSISESIANNDVYDDWYDTIRVSVFGELFSRFFMNSKFVETGGNEMQGM